MPTEDEGSSGEERSEIIVTFKLATQGAEVADDAQAEADMRVLAGEFQDAMKGLFGPEVQIGPPRANGRRGCLLGEISLYVLGPVSVIGPALLSFEQPAFIKALIAGLARRKYKRNVRVPWVRRKVQRRWELSDGRAGPWVVVADNTQPYGWVTKRAALVVTSLLIIYAAVVCQGLIARSDAAKHASLIQEQLTEIRKAIASSTSALQRLQRTEPEALEIRIVDPSKNCVTVMQGARQISTQCPR